jgi:AraC family transcriptional regulator
MWAGYRASAEKKPLRHATSTEVHNALFVIERYLYGDLTLDQIASCCDVSRFHLAHAFGEATGLSVMGYLRGRRLSDAVHALASGANDILSIALDCRYASHEAFSRAFKARLGKTPEEVRKSASVDGLKLVDAIRHLESGAMKLKEPRFENVGELLFVGLSEHVPYEDMQNIAGQWQRFMSTVYSDIPYTLDEPPVGITTDSNDDGIQYVCAAGVGKFDQTPKDCIKITLRPATYAIFEHGGHVAQIRETYNAIWNDWLSRSEYRPIEAPFFERHNDSFDPRTGNGGLTIWIPIRA